jgi:hypothetical protein
MNILVPILYALLAGTIVLVILRVVASASTYFKFRGKRLVTCPENRQPEGVEVDARNAAKEALLRTPHLRLSECSRWPERQNCGQDCLRQIESAPQECLVWNIVRKWYAGKKCVYCHNPIGEVEWMGGHKPALLNAELKTVPWDTIPVERLPEALSAFVPACWSCHIAETFRREHSDLVIDRPASWRSREDVLHAGGDYDASVASNQQHAGERLTK